MIYWMLGACMVTFVASGLYHSYREWQKEEREAEERTRRAIEAMADLRWSKERGWYHENSPISDSRPSNSLVHEETTLT